MENMKAAILTDVQKFEIKQVPMPKIEETDDILVKVLACSICGTDVGFYKNPVKAFRSVPSRDNFIFSLFRFRLRKYEKFGELRAKLPKNRYFCTMKFTLITGASSGIGLAYAEQFAAKEALKLMGESKN